MVSLWIDEGIETMHWLQITYIHGFWIAPVEATLADHLQ